MAPISRFPHDSGRRYHRKSVGSESPESIVDNPVRHWNQLLSSGHTGRSLWTNRSQSGSGSTFIPGCPDGRNTSMPGSLMVDTELLGLLGTRVAALANDVRVVGQDLSGAGRPLLGGSVPACEVVDEVTTHLATTANWVITCATALASLATAAT